MSKSDDLPHKLAAMPLIGSKGKYFTMICEVVSWGLDDWWREMAGTFSKRKRSIKKKAPVPFTWSIINI
jgi:hypothetical protein